MEKEPLETKNLFLIDWLTVTCHGCSTDDVLDLIGMNNTGIPWEIEEKFMNGYPMRCSFNGITIMYGADDARYYKDSTKARKDMGLCLNFSGTGCRTFETYGHGDWFRLLAEFFTIRESGWREKKDGRKFSYNITRVDLAFDDHTEILDIYRIEDDLKHRYYTSKSRYAESTWSDNQDIDIQGLSLQVGADSSDIKIRIYDKAAERGFNDRHWIRVELQLRDDRATAAVSELVSNMHIGNTVRGILANYLVFREPGEDSNKSRWAIADYWNNLLDGMAAISLWQSPGEEYNISKTEYYLKKQYGQAISVLYELHGDLHDLIDHCRQQYPIEKLAPKYKQLLAQLQPRDNFDLVAAPEVNQIFPDAFEQLKLEEDT